MCYDEPLLQKVPTFVTAQLLRSVHLKIRGFPMGGAYNTGIFLRGLKLCGESRTISKCSWYPKRKLGFFAFLSNNKASIWKKNAIHCLYFTVF